MAPLYFGEQPAKMYLASNPNEVVGSIINYNNHNYRPSIWTPSSKRDVDVVRQG